LVRVTDWEVERVVPNALGAPLTPMSQRAKDALGTTRSTSKCAQRTTRALPPDISFSTSFSVAMEVSPGVVIANAPWAAP